MQPLPLPSRRFPGVFVGLLASIAWAAPVLGAVPTGFVQQTVVALSSGTAMAFAPDGRLFVCQQTGALRVIRDGILLPAPFVSLTVDSFNERGLLGVAFDPAFDTTPYVYVYYTVPAPGTHNRISRFLAAGDVATGSEEILLELNPLSSAGNHNGGAIHFGADGKLYAGVGENANGPNAQSPNNLLGKMLRINKDGTIPTDNPFFNNPAFTGNNRAIWAMGLRNPFTFAFDPAGTRMFINDVGASTWEEINDGSAGSNYGWHLHEGIANTPPFVDPLLAYGHDPIPGPSTGCAIAGGAFHDAARVSWPAGFAGDYFYADLCSNWIRRFHPAVGTSEAFATGILSPVDLQIGPNGDLYYLARGAGGVVGRISTDAIFDDNFEAGS